MAHFQQNQPLREGQWDGEDAWADTDTIQPMPSHGAGYADEGYAPDLAEDIAAEMEAMRAERRAKRRLRFRLAAGISDFMGVVIGVGVILLLAALLVTLVNWVITDLRGSFHLW